MVTVGGEVFGSARAGSGVGYTVYSVVINASKQNKSLCELTVSLLVTPNYAVKIICTRKGAGAIDHRHLGINGEKRQTALYLNK